MDYNQAERLIQSAERIADALERAYPKLTPEPLMVPKGTKFIHYRDDPAQLPLPWNSQTDTQYQQRANQAVRAEGQQPFWSESGYVRG